MTDETPLLCIDDEAECAALAAALGNDAALEIVLTELEPDDFWRKANQLIHAAMWKLAAADKPVDAVTLRGEFPAKRRTELSDYLHTLAADPGVVAANVRSYVAAVKDCSLRRRLQAATRAALGDLERGGGEGVHLFRARMAAALEAAPLGSEPAPFIKWPTFWDRDDNEAEWIYPDVLARGRGHAFYAAHGTGKSLLMLCIAAELATGPEPIVVVYLDYEMTEADVFERLENMGYGAATDLSRLRYALLPTLPPLDTAEGAQALTRLIDGVRNDWLDHHLVVIFDTISRAVAGEENDADTFRDFYNHTGIELKRRGVTWARLDHAGKDPTRGQRGTSSKGDDVDVVWRLSQTESGVYLHREKTRMAWVPEKVTFRLDEYPLALTRLASDWPEGTGETANILDRLELPIDASVRTAAAALKAIGEGRRGVLIQAALRWRRERQAEE